MQELKWLCPTLDKYSLTHLARATREQLTDGSPIVLMTASSHELHNLSTLVPNTSTEALGMLSQLKLTSGASRIEEC